MRVAELTAVRQFRLTEANIPDPGPGEIQVAIEAVGICGSDLHAYAEGGVGDMACVYPMVLGHEPAGRVAALGAGVSGWKLGDTAALEPAHYCYHCEQCLRGRHNICQRLRFLSTPGHPGFFRDRVNLPVENLLPLPPSLSVLEGTLVEPMAVVLHSLSLAPPALGDTAVVLGGGPIGLLTTAALLRHGVKRIWAAEPVPARRDLALAMGADAVLDPGKDDLVAAVMADTDGRGVDLVFDCASYPGCEDVSLQVAATGGRVVFTGIPAASRVALDVHLWRRKELQVHQVRRSNHEGAAARDLLASEPRFFAPLITHQRPLESIADAFALVERRDDGVGKLVVRLT